eukprot:TRINITY_DN2120_c0_g1_i1.p5 TRINITY_DN2120_c0_g1~~TRINITY_DN2120_c0_g1_i1.p5  ORF type:complete len:59 (+),score=22.19 TRINITY_DN2120_c0_g1_i1:37-213(+)
MCIRGKVSTQSTWGQTGGRTTRKAKPPDRTPMRTTVRTMTPQRRVTKEATTRSLEKRR